MSINTTRQNALPVLPCMRCIWKSLSANCQNWFIIYLHSWQLLDSLQNTIKSTTRPAHSSFTSALLKRHHLSLPGTKSPALKKIQKIHAKNIFPAGLSCAALLAKYGNSVTVCESHYLPGGAAHSFHHKGYLFDAGPSFFSGLTPERSSNPLKQVLDAIGEKVECVTYDKVRQGLCGFGVCVWIRVFEKYIGVASGCDWQTDGVVYLTRSGL